MVSIEMKDFLQPEKMTVSQFADYVNEVMSLNPVLVEGEVSNFRDIPGRNFCYFDIKDERATAKCFQGFWRSQKVALKNGSKIAVLGYPTLQKNGSFVIDIREIQLLGQGELMEQYLKLKEQLEKEGLFRDDFKKGIPAFPKRVGLIAGKNSSAYYDVVAELKERWKGVEIYFLASKVQGIYAKKEVTAAIKVFNQKAPVDVLVLARGGGSMEDLQAFDSEEVVREIFASKIPIVSAIGHEDHWTLSDFVADVRAKTPTKAAQIAVPDQQEVLGRLDYYSQRASSLLKGKIGEIRARLDNLENTSNLQISSAFEIRRDKLSDIRKRLNRMVLFVLKNQIVRLENMQTVLDQLNPQQILKRGFVVIEKDGKRVRNAKEIKRSDRFSVILHDGEFEGLVK